MYSWGYLYTPHADTKSVVHHALSRLLTLPKKEKGFGTSRTHTRYLTFSLLKTDNWRTTRERRIAKALKQEQLYVYCGPTSRLKCVGVLSCGRTPTNYREMHWTFQWLLSFSASSTNFRMLEMVWVHSRRVSLTSHSQFLFLTGGLVRLGRKSIERGTYFELALIGIEAFACCVVCGASDLLPPRDMIILPPIAVRRVPRARCSFLMARPKITLELCISCDNFNMP